MPAPRCSTSFDHGGAAARATNSVVERETLLHAKTHDFLRLTQRPVTSVACWRAEVDLTRRFKASVCRLESDAPGVFSRVPALRLGGAVARRDHPISGNLVVQLWMVKFRSASCVTIPRKNCPKRSALVIMRFSCPQTKIKSFCKTLVIRSNGLKLPLRSSTGSDMRTKFISERRCPGPQQRQGQHQCHESHGHHARRTSSWTSLSESMHPGIIRC
jgi:hypothetical protein